MALLDEQQDLRLRQRGDLCPAQDQDTLSRHPRGWQQRRQDSLWALQTSSEDKWPM